MRFISLQFGIFDIASMKFHNSTEFRKTSYCEVKMEVKNAIYRLLQLLILKLVTTKKITVMSKLNRGGVEKV